MHYAQGIVRLAKYKPDACGRSVTLGLPGRPTADSSRRTLSGLLSAAREGECRSWFRHGIDAALDPRQLTAARALDGRFADRSTDDQLEVRLRRLCPADRPTASQQEAADCNLSEGSAHNDLPLKGRPGDSPRTSMQAMLTRITDPVRYQVAMWP
jgi:hypothetical protein